MTAAAMLPAIPVAVYVRLSKEDAQGKRLGIESTAVQLKDARAAIAREGWTLDERHVFKDDGVSGTKINRDAWQAMLAAARRREFAMIVVRDLDRFSRLDPVRTLAVIRELADDGVTLWSYRERVAISVEGDQFVFTAMRARQARAEAEKASERITAGLGARAREGRATRQAPFGYRLRIVTEQDAADARRAGDDSLRPGKWWIRYDPEIAVYKYVAAIMLETQSYAATAKRLNENGTRPPKGRAWYHHSVKNLLRQPLARGYWMHKGQRIEHAELRIFTDAEVRRLDAILERASHNRPWAVAVRKATTFNLAVPFVACGVCGGAIVAAGSGKGGRSYLCDRHRLKGCRGIGYRQADAVDRAVVRAVDASLTDEAIAAVCKLVRDELEARPRTREDERARIAREITATEKRIGNLTEAVAEAPAAVRTPLYAKLASEQDRLAALRAALVRVEGAPSELGARRVLAAVQARARALRASLAKGGPEAASAIRAVLGNSRLTAHLVTVDGRRGWKLTGRIAGSYVFDEHHGSDACQKADIKAGAQPPTTKPT